MARGGRRQGTPGRGYSNRTDLGMRPDMSQNTAASGGIVAPAPTPAPQEPALVGPPGRSPDDSPMLLSPSQRPGEPVTAGLSTGPGSGPEALGIDPRAAETMLMKKWLPMLEPIVDEPDTPDSVKMLYRYMRGA